MTHITLEGSVSTLCGGFGFRVPQSWVHGLSNYQLVARDVCRDCLEALKASPPEIEDRGKPVWVWKQGVNLSFGYLSGWSQRFELSVPVGWEIAANELDGVVLQNVYGKRLTAHDAYLEARECQRSFRIRSTAYAGWRL